MQIDSAAVFKLREKRACVIGVRVVGLKLILSTYEKPYLLFVNQEISRNFWNATHISPLIHSKGTILACSSTNCVLLCQAHSLCSPLCQRHYGRKV